MLKQHLHFKLSQKLSPQQIQLMKMLQLPTIELEKRIKEELEINPALDEGEDQSQESTEINSDASIEKREGIENNHGTTVSLNMILAPLEIEKRNEDDRKYSPHPID